MSPDEPRWLDEDERETWIALTAMLIRLAGGLDRQLQRDAGISHFEYQVLSGLSMSPERTLRMGELAVLAEGSLSRLSHVVKRLERQGWVRRTPDPGDGRYTLAILTDAGWDKVVASAPGHVREVRRLVFTPLTRAQQRQLLAITRRVNTALGSECPSWKPEGASEGPA
ncbi:MarR family winged helix-turn-helix transcriptional regulator [Streptomyces sp. TS71-3]|uniref:MarR family winged helix-turn-helix transcriptional regulator n=1 Tax=Streptomyces sp. TS71-3 TaxID=2733862 RepID=UPI001B03ACC2|nr:MarR family winged helix-turn-helix transcriptional regulator [Streptomyces sp. TS71-3]GHJ37235.1 MarR family transcriptional regulator [Streptomyces sp. TS71-3]